MQVTTGNTSRAFMSYSFLFCFVLLSTQGSGVTAGFSVYFRLRGHQKAVRDNYADPREGKRPEQSQQRTETTHSVSTTCTFFGGGSRRDVRQRVSRTNRVTESRVTEGSGK